MVSLRGSKYGSRVAMLCCNPAFTIRPGAPSMPVRNYYNPGPQYNHHQGYTERPQVSSYAYNNGYNPSVYRHNNHSNFGGSTFR
jgi:hypothetical protein